MRATAMLNRLTATLVLGAAGLWTPGVGTTPAQADPARVGAAPLNLRNAAAITASIVVRMPPGAAVQVLHCRGDWCRLRYQGTSGFAMARYLDRDGDAGSAAQAQAPASAVAPGPASMPARVATSRASTITDDDRNARVWRWDDPEWRDQHARRVQWHQRHAH